MKPLFKYISVLLFLNIVIAGAASLLISTVPLPFSLSDVVILSFLFSLIIVVSLLVFLRGQKKEPAGQTFHTLIAIGIKLLLELILALFWFIIAKKNSSTAVITFFVIYLTLTSYLVQVILKTLKNNSI